MQDICKKCVYGQKILEKYAGKSTKRIAISGIAHPIKSVKLIKKCLGCIYSDAEHIEKGRASFAISSRMLKDNFKEA